MQNILSFLEALARNNNRDWFNLNKKLYQESLEAFREFTGVVLTGITQLDPTLGDLQAKDTIFRIYKDIRFSKDKTPYKTHFASWMAKGGRKSTDAGYYFHLEPGNSFMAAGVWMPPKEQLTLIRQEIMYNPTSYFSVINDTFINTKYERGGKEDMLKKGPAGFPKDFEYMEELKYKHHVFSKNYSNEEVLKQGFSDALINDFKGLFPLVDYLNHAMSFTGNE
ncbi:MAG: DUF2461 domain-containing protein [Bacteroidota bacterium]